MPPDALCPLNDMFWTVDQGHMKDWDGPPPQKDIQKAENGTLNQGLLSVDKVSTR